MSKINNYSDLNQDQRLLELFNQLHAYTTTKHEDERRNLAYKLNNQAIQSLLALHIQLSTHVSQPSTSLLPEVTDSLTEIANLVDELKVIARELRPLEIDTLNLVDTLELECAVFSNYTQIPVTFAAADVPHVPEHLALPLFRLLQATLDNVHHHANASQVWVNIRLIDQHLVLKVEDNGQGLETVGQIEKLADAPGLRLFDLMLCFQHAGGRLTLQSHPDEGTKVTAVLPLNPENPIP